MSRSAIVFSRISSTITFNLLLFAALMFTVLTHGNLANLTQNDPYPYYSTRFPYAYLTKYQKLNLMQFEYSYPVYKFRTSVSPFRQSATFARDHNRNIINLGDLQGRWNMLALFYDPPTRVKLMNALCIEPNCTAPDMGTCEDDACGLPNNPCLQDRQPCNPTCFGCDDGSGIICTDGESKCAPPDCICWMNIIDPRKIDPNKEFGFFTVPMLYRKYGVRIEHEMLLYDCCWYAIGFKAQVGIVDVRQTVLAFQDLTCQALGIACPGPGEPDPTTCPEPTPTAPVAVAPPFANEANIPPCPVALNASPCGQFAAPTVPKNCVLLQQGFTPCCNATCCLSFDCDCKKFVIEKIMKRKDIITDVLDIDICSFHRTGMEDLRLYLYWRQLYKINEEDELYPRVYFMPFAELGVGVPLDQAVDPHKRFALPLGNNTHPSIGFMGGFTIDYLDTITLSVQAGFTRFFERSFCNVMLPTVPQEGGIFPYKADITVRPGTSQFFGLGMNASHFLPNFSFWAEWIYVSHAEDEITVCRAHIPSTSNYFKPGFDVPLAECLSKWEAHVVNAAFNYDLSRHLEIGLFWQIPVRQRNVYRSGTVMGSVTFLY